MMTLVLGSHNHERYLEEAVRSVYAQTSPFDRIVFFSDGSSDHTLPLARRLFADDQRLVWLDALEENHGVVRRFREAFSRIRDSYVMIVSGDDVLYPKACETFRRMASKQAFGWAVGATQVTDNDLAPMWLADPTQHDFGSAQVSFLEYLLTRSGWFPIQGWCFHKDLLDRIGGLREGLRAEDFYLGVKFAAESPPLLTGELIAQYRIHDQSFHGANADIVFAEHARVALGFFRRMPRLSLYAASRWYAGAAGEALRRRAYGRVARFGAASVALCPRPISAARWVLREWRSDHSGDGTALRKSSSAR